jgi:hypothetical protein
MIEEVAVVDRQAVQRTKGKMTSSSDPANEIKALIDFRNLRLAGCDVAGIVQDVKSSHQVVEWS